MTKEKYSQVFIDNGWGQHAGQHYSVRRRRLAAEVKGPIVLWGVSHSIGHPHSWAVVNAPVYQDPFLLYLTGINQPGIAIGLHRLPNGSVNEVLFLPKKDSKTEFWEGAKLGYEPKGGQDELKAKTGFSTILPISSLKTWLKESSAASKKTHSFWTGKKPRAIQQLFKWGIADGYKIESLGPIRYEQALIFDDQDWQNLRKAHVKTAQIFTQLVAAVPKASSEQDIHATMLHAISKATSRGPAFAPIIASGANAAVLHYTKNDDPLHKSELLLLDFGIRDPLIVTDVTRTIPLSGTFNPLQRLLYEIVLDTQLGVEKRVKPGISIQVLNEWCWAHIGTLLDSRFYKQGGMAKLSYIANKPHFVSHLIGYAVHDGDPSRDYRHLPLKSGLIISNEPGIYGTFDITINGEHFHETIGIRIEDDLRVTDTGCENLSAAIPKSVLEIEKAMAIAARSPK